MRNPRITITFPQDVLECANTIAKRYQFRSTAMLITTLARMAFDAMERHSKAKPGMSIKDEIAEIFSDYTYWERSPCGEVPKKSRSISFENYECKDFYKRMGYFSTDDAAKDLGGYIEGENGTGGFDAIAASVDSADLCDADTEGDGWCQDC